MLTIKYILSSKNITLRSGRDTGQGGDITQKMVVMKRRSRRRAERRDSGAASGLAADGHAGLFARKQPQHRAAVSDKK